MSTATQRRPQKRDFETQGIPVPGQDYLVENRHIVNQKGIPIRQLVDQGRYFTIFAPRQIGKTTFFAEFCPQTETGSALRADSFEFPNCQNIRHFQILRKIPT